MDELKKLNDQLGANVKALQDEHTRLTIEGKSTSDKMEKITAEMADLQTKHTKLQGELTQKEGAVKDFEQKMVALEGKIVDMSKPNGNGVKQNYKESAEYKALNVYAFGGAQMLSTSERKAWEMRTDINSAGGYLVPDLMAKEIIKQVTDISVVRQFARGWSGKQKSISIPVRTSLPTAYWEGELEDTDPSKPAYRMVRLTAFRHSAKIGISQDLSDFAAFDVESSVMEDLRLAYAQGEGNKFLKGTGANEPEGLLVNATAVAAATDTTEAVGAPITGAGLLVDALNLPGGTTPLKAGYLANSRYYMALASVIKMRTAVSSAGGFLWAVGGESMPNTLNGYPVVVMPDMPVIADGAGSKIIMFGDLRQAYSIFDAAGIGMVRDEVTSAGKALTYLYFHRYLTGAVVIPEAIKLLKVKA